MEVSLSIKSPSIHADRCNPIREKKKVKRETTGAEVNELLKSASEDGPLKGIMGYEARPLVSTDYTNDERSGIIDARSTMVVDGTCVKVRARVGAYRLAWTSPRSPLGAIQAIVGK